MVAAEPKLGNVTPALVLRDLCGRQMAVVVDDRLRCSILMVKVSRLRCLKQEIIVDEVHGSFRAPNGKCFVSAKGVECMVLFNVPRWIPWPR